MVLVTPRPVRRHARLFLAQDGEHLFDLFVVDHLAEADPFGVVGRNLQDQISVGEPKDQVLAFLSERRHLLAPLNYRRAVVGIHDFVAYVEHKKAPRGTNRPRLALGRPRKVGGAEHRRTSSLPARPTHGPHRGALRRCNGPRWRSLPGGRGPLSPTWLGPRRPPRPAPGRTTEALMMRLELENATTSRSSRVGGNRGSLWRMR